MVKCGGVSGGGSDGVIGADGDDDTRTLDARESEVRCWSHSVAASCL